MSGFSIVNVCLLNYVVCLYACQTSRIFVSMLNYAMLEFDDMRVMNKLRSKSICYLSYV
jgi:hypothetical protein